MKKSKEINNFHNEFLTHIESIEILLNDYKKRIKKEYQQLLIEEKNKLLYKVAEGEKMNVNDLKKKYLKAKEITLTDEVKPQIIENNEELLDKLVIEGEVYYYENKEKGKVFDMSNSEVGIYKNGSILFNS